MDDARLMRCCRSAKRAGVIMRLTAALAMAGALVSSCGLARAEQRAAASPIEIFHPGPTADQRWAARMAKARLEAAVVVEDDTPACYRWYDPSTLLGDPQ